VKVLYVSPAFPSGSAVFEQNEILGLVHVCDEVAVLSCRPAWLIRDEPHQFARSIVPLVRYPGVLAGLAGIFAALARRPSAAIHVAGVALCAWYRQPRSLKVLVAAMVAFSAYWRIRGHWDWIHADFGSNVATAAMFLARLQGAPYSYKVHAFEIFSRDEKSRDVLFEEKAALARIVFSEHRFGAETLARHLGWDPSAIAVHYSSVRLRDLVVLPVERADSAVFVAMGRLVPKKGFDVLLRAVKELGSTAAVELRIFGSGPERGPLERLAKDLGVSDRVAFFGRYDNSEIPSILKDATALVVPSVRTLDGDMDGVPTVIYEALGSGRAVVASALSAIPEVVRDGETGLLVPAGDPSALAAAMRRLMSDRDLSQRLGIKGRLVVEDRHSHIAAARELIGHWSNALNARSRLEGGGPL
jgi:glycosyltransferase involved in cell wall biosynthesis